jgi:GNAT superfamily N-acetyltransferase
VTPVARRARPADRHAVDTFLSERGTEVVARLGELVDARVHPALVVDGREALEGVLTYVVRRSDCEILTLHATRTRAGVGSALIAAVVEVARAAGCTRLWVLTTNDNVDALRFYQRRGFVLAELHPGAVERSRRTLKPSIPEVGDYGIPLRDELVLERRLPA